MGGDDIVIRLEIAALLVRNAHDPANAACLERGPAAHRVSVIVPG